MNVTTPRIIGHEFSGEVVRLGSNVTGWKERDRVVAELHTGACGHCEFCQSGDRHLCYSKTPLGYGWDGAFAQYLRVPACLLHKIPDEVSWDAAAFMEPLAICIEALVNHTGFQKGYSVAIAGAGPIGLLSLLLVRALGAETVIMGGTSRSASLKLSKARELGAGITVQTDREDFTDAVMKYTSNRGVNVYIEASGDEQMIKIAPDIIKKGGSICALGLSGKPAVPFAWDRTMFKACTVTFNYSSGYKAWELGLELMESGRLNPEPLITHKLSLSEFNKAIKYMEKGEAIKVILKP
jgi:threonine dehydrogenase-like Zn-dependent dehydrogenase